MHIVLYQTKNTKTFNIFHSIRPEKEDQSRIQTDCISWRWKNMPKYIFRVVHWFLFSDTLNNKSLILTFNWFICWRWVRWQVLEFERPPLCLTWGLTLWALPIRTTARPTEPTHSMQSGRHWHRGTLTMPFPSATPIHSLVIRTTPHLSKRLRYRCEFLLSHPSLQTSIYFIKKGFHVGLQRTLMILWSFRVSIFLRLNLSRWNQKSN